VHGENATVELLDYQIPVTQLVTMRTRNIVFFSGILIDIRDGNEIKLITLFKSVGVAVLGVLKALEEAWLCKKI